VWGNTHAGRCANRWRLLRKHSGFEAVLLMIGMDTHKRVDLRVRFEQAPHRAITGDLAIGCDDETSVFGQIDLWRGPHQTHGIFVEIVNADDVPRPGVEQRRRRGYFVQRDAAQGVSSG
jgi:hypothetical protein